MTHVTSPWDSPLISTAMASWEFDTCRINEIYRIYQTTIRKRQTQVLEEQLKVNHTYGGELPFSFSKKKSSCQGCDEK